MVTRLLTLAGALLLLSAAPAQAAIFNVTKTADTDDGSCTAADCSLREAIEAANTAGTADDVNVPPGSYTLTTASGGELVVTGAVTINGAGAGATVIRAAPFSRVLRASIGSIAFPPPATFIRNMTITGGATADLLNGGGGLLNTVDGTMVVENSVVTGNSFTATDNSSFGGGGIANHSGGGLTVIDSTVSDNDVLYDNAPTGGGGRGGGGIQTTAGNLTILRSTISGNTVEEIGITAPAETGGGGIHATGPGVMEITNSTVSGNRATVGTGTNNGAGGIFHSSSNDLQLSHVTLAGNSTNGDGGALLDASVQAFTGLANTIVADNTSQSASTSGCAGAVTSSDFNMEWPGATCNPSGSDFPNTDPQLGPLASNGGPTQTHALPPGSPAIDAFGTAISCPGGAEEDQRGVLRPKGSACDIGAYEFDGLSSATGAPCFTGPVGVTLFPPSGAAANAVRARIDGGPETSSPAGGNPPGALVAVPDGAHTLEYWGDFTSGQELAHHTANVLVDTAPPVVTIASDQDTNGYTVGERASFSVRATDQGSGLASDPSATRQRIDTSRPGTRTIRRSATDACGNVTTAELAIRVLPVPEYGEEVNLFPVSGRVTIGVIRRLRSGAHAAQKGRSFVPLEQARQVPVGTFVNTRRGRVRLVSSRAPNSRRIQSGEFFSGLFQALQSRSRRARGLTELVLKGSSFRSCRRGARGKRAQAAQSIRRRLRANARGRFRTRGRHSAATVRGTVWLTADRCDGTLTRVTRGRVAVRDFRRKRTVLVRAGKSYLAKAPR
jgi:CSLREA domain-containing protein